MATTPLRADSNDILSRAAAPVDPANDAALLALRSILMGYDPGTGTARRGQLAGDGLLTASAVSTRDQRFAYDSGGNLSYFGESSQGSATSAPAWTIAYMQYDGSGNLISKTAAYGAIWDNRTSVPYT